MATQSLEKLETLAQSIKNAVPFIGVQDKIFL